MQGLVVQLAEKHLKCSTADESRRKDQVSHFVLRLAYCRTEDLRRWFLQQECELFRCRFKNEMPTSQVNCQAQSPTVVDNYTVHECSSSSALTSKHHSASTPLA